MDFDYIIHYLYHDLLSMVLQGNEN